MTEPIDEPQTVEDHTERALAGGLLHDGSESLVNFTIEAGEYQSTPSGHPFTVGGSPGCWPRREEK